MYIYKQAVFYGLGNKVILQIFQAAEWKERSEKFMEGVALVQQLAIKFKEIPNQAIHYYFFPYLWDMVGVLQTCSTYIKWLGMSGCISVLIFWIEFFFFFIPCCTIVAWYYGFTLDVPMSVHLTFIRIFIF